jgi:thioredoxin-like negative regulator of GroEL
MADESAATEQVAQAFNVVEVPTFIFLRNGKEVARHVGSSRGDLIGKILQVRLWHWVAAHAAVHYTLNSATNSTTDG